MSASTGPGPEADEEGVTLASGDVRVEPCLRCGADDALMTADAYALTADAVCRVGTLAVCLICHWSPYT